MMLKNKNYILFLKLFLLVSFIFLIRTFFFTSSVIWGDSMRNSLNSGDIVIVNKLHNTITREDIIVFAFPEEKKKHVLIKRVIGIPGDEIEIKEGVLFVNGIKHSQAPDEVSMKDKKYTIPKDKYFVLGDNRENSFDSVFFGYVDKEDIIGKVFLKIYPLKEAGKVN